MQCKRQTFIGGAIVYSVSEVTETIADMYDAYMAMIPMQLSILYSAY